MRFKFYFWFCFCFFFWKLMSEVLSFTITTTQTLTHPGFSTGKCCPPPPPSHQQGQQEVVCSDSPVSWRLRLFWLACRAWRWRRPPSCRRWTCASRGSHSSRSSPVLNDRELQLCRVISIYFGKAFLSEIRLTRRQFGRMPTVWATKWTSLNISSGWEGPCAVRSKLN